jgi:hypothetical protein
MEEKDLVSFWRLDQLEELGDDGPAAVRPKGRFFAFTDGTINSRSYAVRLSENPSDLDTVISTLDDSEGVASSFEGFLKLYRTRGPDNIFPRK